jgi:hypothetical protein
LAPQNINYDHDNSSNEQLRWFGDPYIEADCEAEKQEDSPPAATTPEPGASIALIVARKVTGTQTTGSDSTKRQP